MSSTPLSHHAHAPGDERDVSVIIPTRALSLRAPLIHRALDSVLSQSQVRVFPIVVANGAQRDPALLRELADDPRIHLIDREQPGLPGALRTGREAVRTTWFSTLDDDDVYLPDTLAARVDALRAQPDRDTVITSGLVRDGNREWLHPEDLRAVQEQPLDALTRGNWLLPGAWLCRSQQVGSWLFHGMPKALECTFLAIQFALHGKPCFLDEPGVVWHSDTPDSESKAPDYIHHQLTALKTILELPLPADARRWVRRVHTATQHSIADAHYTDGRVCQAWRWHLRSLLGAGGLRYASFGMRLLLAKRGR